ncbi:MAG TPA: transcriptional regulator [Desulfuromonadaceae bacterium]
MGRKPLKPAVPRPALDTVRHAVAELIRDQPLSAREISARAHITEKEVYDHLDHIRHSIHAGGGWLEVTPAECRACGFVFAKRDRLTPPGRCPVCRHEAIFEPLFAIRQQSGHED